MNFHNSLSFHNDQQGIKWYDKKTQWNINKNSTKSFLLSIKGHLAPCSLTPKLTFKSPINYPKKNL
jgi:hypothetical protein